MRVTSKITGVGSYIPTEVVENDAFLGHEFYESNGQKIDSDNEEIIRKFQSITGIDSRRYARDEYHTSELGTFAAEKAIEDAGIDPETLDQIIVAHNFGDVSKTNQQSDILPSISARIKHNLKIKNNSCVAYDILFGCPGWIQGVIQADSYIKSGMADNVLVIGTETLSRVIDPHDRDSMIYSDGAGASIVSRKKTDDRTGILSFSAESYTFEEAFYLHYGKSYKPEKVDNTLYVKMLGRKIYEFSLNRVPLAMKACLDRSGENINDVKKIFIHQANEKMDEAIVQRFYKLYGIRRMPADIMPMSIHYLGNSSVATVPTLYDLVLKGVCKGHNVSEGDLIMFASVGSGMNINAIAYRV